MDAVLTVLLERVGNTAFSLGREVAGFRNRNKNTVDEIRKWEQILPDLGLLLKDAEEKKSSDPGIRSWLEDLDALAYDMEDTLDHFNYEINQNSIKRKLLSWFSSRLDSSVIEIGRSLQEIKQNKEVLDLVPRGESHTNVDEDGRQGPVPPAFEKVIYGREEEKRCIREFLLKDQKGVRVVPIVGVGGIGKTTLGRYAYNYDFQGFYDVKGWCISKDYNRIQAWKGIIESVTSRPFSLTDMGAIQEHVNELLKGKKFFIVIDDLCKISNVEWEAFRAPFLSGKDGSKVIVTTRFPAVARTVGTVDEYLTVRELTDNDEYWSLLCSCAGLENVEDSKASIGRNIAKKCSGIPLAIVLVGGILKSKTDECDWEDVLNSEAWDATMSVVKMSFDDLPYNLKSCLLFLAMFPKNYEFEEKEVARLWYGAGLIVSAQQREDVRCLIKEGRRHFRELVNRSLLMSFGNGYRMPDVIREMGIEMSGNKFCCWDPNIGSVERIRHLTLQCRMLHQFVENVNRIDKLSSLRMIMITDGYKSSIQLQTSDLHIMFRKLKNPRVVSLRSCSISKLPKSVGQMKLLRYLDLSDNPICKLPSEIGKLTSLRYLKLCNSIEVLPSTIGSLTNLSELDLRGCKLKELPLEIGKLINLFKLDLSCCRELKELPLEIGKLTNLTEFYLAKCHALEVILPKIGNLINLSELHLAKCRSLPEIPS